YANTFVFHGYIAQPDIHSFPTRRSSDLETGRLRSVLPGGVNRCGSSVVFPGPPECGELKRAGGKLRPAIQGAGDSCLGLGAILRDRKSTRLNSSHVKISYAVFCLKKKI